MDYQAKLLFLVIACVLLSIVFVVYNCLKLDAKHAALKSRVLDGLKKRASDR